MKIQDRFNYLWEPCFTEATPTAMGEVHEGTGERRVVLVFHSTNGPSQTAFLSPGEAENLSTILATAAKQARSIKVNTLQAAPDNHTCKMAEDSLLCETCGVEMSDVCPACEGRGHHKTGCLEVFSNPAEETA
jgi:hypothetical protein